jgi:hypothetical protein
LEILSMVFCALILAACGVVLGSCLRVFVLFPASFLAWCCAIAFACMTGLSFLAALATGLLFATSVQLGYLAGVALMGFAAALRRRRRVMALH